MKEALQYADPPSNAMNKIAKTISAVVNPVFVGIFTIGILMFKASDDPTRALLWFTLTVCLTAIPPLAYVIYLVKIGYLVDIYMPVRERRVKPMTVSVAWLILSMTILYFLGAPREMIILLVAVLVQMALMWLITFMWKISFHSATITAAAVVAFWLNSIIFWPAVILTVLVAWSRVQLKRHTVMQVLAGILVSAVMTIFTMRILERYLTF